MGRQGYSTGALGSTDRIPVADAGAGAVFISTLRRISTLPVVAEFCLM